MWPERPGVAKVLLTLRKMSLSINLPKVCGPRDQAYLRFCLTLRKMSLSINLPKFCGPRDQAYLRFYLTLRKMIERYQFTQGMWFEEPSMTKVLFDT